MLGFKTKKALKAEIQRIISQHDFYEEFQCDLLSRLFADHHYFFRELGVYPSLFRKEWRHGGSGYNFCGFIEGRGWRIISWNKAVAETTFEKHLISALRKQATEIANRNRKTECELCGGFAEDVHHESPAFKDIAARCMETVTRDDRRWLLENYFESDTTENWCLPLTHPAVKLLEILHEHAVLISVCKDCHKRLRHK